MAQLMKYEDASYVREASEEEVNNSLNAAQIDGGAGVISVDGISCYVIGDAATEIAAHRVSGEPAETEFQFLTR